MELSVNDYVRTRNIGGSIEKIIEILPKEKAEDLITRYATDVSIKYSQTITENEIIKSSSNIIKLFEEHDLVVIEYYSLRYKERVTRLFEVDYKDKEFMTLKNAYCDFMLRNNEFNDEDKKLKPIIKSIVTKEQFSAMEYKVESGVK